MITLEQIRKPIEADLKEFDNFIIEQFKADTPMMSELLTYAISTRGKSIRPILAMLSAGLTSKSGVITRRCWVAAMMVEMIHLASLIHDDVIDEADSRRGKPSLNALWQSRKAVLTGDYILGRTLSIGMQSGQYDLVKHISAVIATLCEGEVLQDDLAKRTEMTRESYIDIIMRKTASLIATSTSAGAISSGAAHADVVKMREMGEAIGAAFQIQDDILDYCPNANSGKPTNNDLREGKITLPLLHLMEESSAEERAKISELLKQCHNDENAVQTLQQMVENSDSIDFAKQVMQAYIAKATNILGQYPESEYRSSLINLCLFIGQRDR